MIIKIKSVLYFLSISLLCFVLGMGLLDNGDFVFSQVKPFTVVVDAGHGEPDGGAVGVGGTLEKDINLSIALKVREILESHGVRVIMTREDDNAIYDSNADSLHEKKVSDMRNRADIVNKSNADLFLSIHMNSFPDHKSQGLHIFYTALHPEAKTLANNIQTEISKITGAKTHTVKTASQSLYLMKNSKIPTVLAECGFLSNPEEEKLLNDDTYQSKIAFGLSRAILYKKIE